MNDKVYNILCKWYAMNINKLIVVCLTSDLCVFSFKMKAEDVFSAHVRSLFYVYGVVLKVNSSRIPVTSVRTLGEDMRG